VILILSDYEQETQFALQLILIFPKHFRNMPNFYSDLAVLARCIDRTPIVFASDIIAIFWNFF